MPHIIFEVPALSDKDLSIEIISQVQSLLVDKLPTKLESFKSRVYSYDNCLVAGSVNNSFYHMSIKVLSGRTSALLAQLSVEVREIILSHLVINNQKNAIVTVEILELSTAYAK